MSQKKIFKRLKYLLGKLKKIKFKKKYILINIKIIKMERLGYFQIILLKSNLKKPNQKSIGRNS